MPDIVLSSQALDLAFHPQSDLVFTSHLDGQVVCYAYGETGSVVHRWKARLSKKSARTIDASPNGDALWCGYRSGMMCAFDTATGKVLKEWSKAHDPPVSRMTALGGSMHLFASGDDDGAVKLWDTRSSASSIDAVRVYTHHTDYISDFVWVADKKHLVVTSGDGTLSVLDVRSNKSRPFSQSEDQEDELLSVVSIKGGKKLVVGTQLGPLLVYDRAKGYADCVDRFLGHPQSVESIVNLSTSALTQDVIATGSSDGLIRVVQIHPSKFLGVIAEHGGSVDANENDKTEGLPVERMKLDRHGKWLGSTGHDEVLKLTDVEGALEGSDDGEDSSDEDVDATSDDAVANALSKEEEIDGGKADLQPTEEESSVQEEDEAKAEAASDSSEEAPQSINSRLSRKRRRKEKKREEAKRRKKSGPPNTFFADL